MTRLGVVTERDDGLGTDGRSVTEGAPVVSVVVLSYNSRRRIDFALESLRCQDFAEPWEVIVVDSGEDGCAEYLAAAYPEVRLERRLYLGPARNAGLRLARGRYVAFLPDDGIAEPDWLRRRVAKHREGFAAVGGAVTNGTPRHPVGTAGYLIEYPSLLPSKRVLERQGRTPHSLSYERSLLERLGPFPEDMATGEDTVLNLRWVKAGASIGFDPEIKLAHRNLTGLRAYLRHQYAHGRDFGRIGRWNPARPANPPEESVVRAGYRILIRYPARRWWRTLRRLEAGQRRLLPAYLALTPVVCAGLWAAALGRWVGWRSRWCEPSHDGGTTPA
jgi:glycosyltransferase involved in cell wall biosynthesis